MAVTINAKLVEEELRAKFRSIWYNPVYQYYFGSNFRYDYAVNDECRREFAIIKPKDNIDTDIDKSIVTIEPIGVISYAFNTETKVADKFGFIHFQHEFDGETLKSKEVLTKEKIIIAKALKQTIVDVFDKYGASVVEICVIDGNPVQSGYKKLIERIGGRQIAVRTGRAILLNGDIRDCIDYEVTREAWVGYKTFAICRGMMNKKMFQYEKKNIEKSAEENS